MTPEALKRGGISIVIAVAAVLALTALAVPALAAAEIQHWTSAPQLPAASPKFVSGKAVNTNVLEWKINEGVTLTCSTLSSSGSVENPSSAEGEASISTTSQKFENCVVGSGYSTKCVLKNRSIPFESLKTRVYQEAGQDFVEFKPASGTTLARLEIENLGGCPFSGTYYVTGTYSAKALSSSHFEVTPSTSHLSSSGSELTMSNQFDLVGNSGKLVTVANTHVPTTVPRWFYEWVNLSAGSASLFETTGEMSIDFKSTHNASNMEIKCDGAYNRMRGAVENPVGGTAGLMSNTEVVFANCGMPQLTLQRCVVQPVESAAMSGVATEVGGTPTVELSTAGGGPITTFVVEEGTGGSKKCQFIGSYALKGKLVMSTAEIGFFKLSGNGLTLAGQAATATGSTALSNYAGELLGLRP